jgi:ribose 5-phosphate isomerase B
MNMPSSEQLIGIACDHGGYEMKEFLKAKLIEFGLKVVDYGTNSPESVDYPDFIHPIARDVNDTKLKTAVIICGSGNGAQMTANKYGNVRAALCWNVELASLARQHNDANILALPGRFVSFELAWSMVKVFIETDFEGGRHSGRVSKIGRIQ